MLWSFPENLCPYGIRLRRIEIEIGEAFQSACRGRRPEPFETPRLAPMSIGVKTSGLLRTTVGAGRLEAVS
jgi:hypothetical protein